MVSKTEGQVMKTEREREMRNKNSKMSFSLSVFQHEIGIFIGTH